MPTPEQKRPLLLIIDDDPGVTSSLKRLFHREPYDVMCVSDARHALQAILESEVSVLICDENMPEVRGSDLLIKIKDRWPDMVSLLITGSTDIDVAIRAINEGGAYRLIRKPWNDDEMLIVIRQAFERHQLQRENRCLRDIVSRFQSLVLTLQDQYPGIIHLRSK